MDQAALEKALQGAFKDQSESPPAAEDATLIHGHETVGGVDPNFAGKLHDKLAETADNPIDEPSGLRAPASTRMLTAKELASLDDEDDDEEKVLDHHDHGVIDHVDAKLVTELNKKLCDEVAHPHLPSALDKPGASEPSASGRHDEARASADFSVDLSAALQKKLAGNDDFTAAVERRFSAITHPENGEAKEVSNSGLRAPQCTVKLSAQALVGLDDDDEVVDSALIVAQTHGAIENVDKSLVAELQKKLSGGGQESRSSSKGRSASKNKSEEEDHSGFRAPANTVKLTTAMLPPDDDDDEIPDGPTIDCKSHGNIDSIDANFVSALQQRLEDNEEEEESPQIVERGCRAPQPTVKLSEDMLANLDEEELREDADDPLSVPCAAAAALNKFADPSSPPATFSRDQNDEEVADISGGLRAPQPTKLITADMLVGLDDEDDIEMVQDPVAAGMAMQGATAEAAFSVGSQSNAAKPKKGVGFSGGNFDASFADSLQRKLGGEAGKEEVPEVFSDDEERATKYSSGLKAPATTVQITADQLAQLDDDDDPPTMESMLQSAAMGLDATLDPSLQDGIKLIKSQAGAGQPPLQGAIPSGPNAEQMATLTAAAAALQDVTPPNHAPEQEGLLSPQAALTMDSMSVTKVIQTARGLPEGTDVWGPPGPLTSSCKLRLAWLSKDEVRKENEQLRKEISSLRAEINMHRKETALAMKM